MSLYSCYHPMSFDDAKRLSHFQAQQYALERISSLMRDDIMRAAFTADEQATLHGVLANACQRIEAGIAEYDHCKRLEPVLVSDREDVAP